MSKEQKRLNEVRALCQELPLIMNRVHAAGLHRTGHKMHEAVKEIGYEAEKFFAALPEDRT